MRIIEIDTKEEITHYDEEKNKFYTTKRKPTYNLLVELTQKEYQIISFYLELDKKSRLKVGLTLPNIKENK